MRIYTFLGLLLISCAFAQNATQCPKFECSTLPNNTCASVTANGIIVNQDGCPDQQGCSLADLILDPNTVRNITCAPLSTISVQPSTRLLQATNTTTVVVPSNATTAESAGNITVTTANVTSATVPAPAPAPSNATTPTVVNVTTVSPNATEPTSEPPTPVVNATTTTISQTNITAVGVNATSPEVNATGITTAPTFNCTSPVGQKDLQDGSYPKECTSTSDCLLEDGTSNECVCGADGKQYCQPDINSEVFNDFWQLCSDNKMNTTLYDDWKIYAQYYVYIESAPSCMDKIFPELKTGTSAQNYASEESSYGMLLGLSGLIWIVLLS